MLDLERARRAVRVYYQLWRNMVFAEWMARSDGYDTGAYVANLTRLGQESESCSHFTEMLTAAFAGHFIHLSWEDLYCRMTDSQGLARLRRYMATKTAALIRAFKLTPRPLSQTDLSSGGTEMPIELFGYSERGMINALCDDIRRGDESVARLETFLGWCCFPLAETKPIFKEIQRVTLVVEQSFSDFGELDLLILLDYQDGRKQAILAEAKVCTDTGSPKRIHHQWDDFLSYLGGDGSKRSSLFVQLYRKVKLIRKVANLNQELPPDAVARRWSLGNNRVVLQAAARLAEYRHDPWYLAIVPDRSEEVAPFFRDPLANFNSPPDELPDWAVNRWGFITWPELHERVQQQANEWPQLTRNFVWNKHQIYPIPQQPAVGQPGLIPPQGFCLHGARVVYVAWPSEKNCRVVPTDDLGVYFPKSFLVPTASLGTTNPPAQPVEAGTLRPTFGNVYQWDPPQDEDPRPPRGSPVPVPPRPVRIRAAGWDTSAVWQVDANGLEFGDPFHVFNHHLRRGS